VSNNWEAIELNTVGYKYPEKGDKQTDLQPLLDEIREGRQKRPQFTYP